MESVLQETRTAASELEEPRWSVVSFEGLAASGLTYAQAAKIITELENEKVAGLCLVTDEAAANLKS